MRWLAVALLAGCGGGRPAPPSPPTPGVPTVPPPAQLRVVNASGKPVANALLVVSDPTTGDPVAHARTEADGSFTVASTGEIAITAMSPAGDGWAFAPHFDPRPPQELHLRTDCEPFAGRVRGSAPPFIDVGRSSDDNGDLFAIAIGSDGAFRACLPSGTYAAEISPDQRTPRVFAHTPVTDLELPIDGRAHFETDASNVGGIAGEDLAAFVAGVPAGVDVIGLGETNHGTREFNTDRADITLALVREHGVRLVMMEAGYAEVEPVDDYLNGANIDVTQAVAKLGYWVWDTKTFLGMLRGMRAANLKRASKDRIHLVGFDMQDTGAAIRQLIAAGAVPAASLPTFEQLIDKNGAAWPGLTAEQRASVVAAVEPVATRRDGGGVTSTTNRLALAAHELLLRLHALESAEMWARNAARDRGMAELALDILSRAPTPRAALWAHLGHLSRSYVIGEPAMGSFLARQLGSRYQVYALLAGSGSARAWDAAQEIGVVPRELPPAPAYALETMLAAHRIGRVSYFRFATATAPAATWLAGLHPLREFGAVHPKPDKEFHPFDLSALDGAILFDEVHPTDPTPTGERHK